MLSVCPYIYQTKLLKSLRAANHQKEKSKFLRYLPFLSLSPHFLFSFFVPTNVTDSCSYLTYQSEVYSSRSNEYKLNKAYITEKVEKPQSDQIYEFFILDFFPNLWKLFPWASIVMTIFPLYHSFNFHSFAYLQPTPANNKQKILDAYNL